MASSLTGVCENCVAGHRLPGEPTGQIILVEGMHSYFRSATSTSAEHEGAPEKKAIVLLTDAFGLPMPNGQIIVDALVKDLGVDGYVPDIFAGEQYLRLSRDARNGLVERICIFLSRKSTLRIR